LVRLGAVVDLQAIDEVALQECCGEARPTFAIHLEPPAARELRYEGTEVDTPSSRQDGRQDQHLGPCFLPRRLSIVRGGVGGCDDHFAFGSEDRCIGTDRTARVDDHTRRLARGADVAGR
jgi:hypothetical protein